MAGTWRVVECQPQIHFADVEEHEDASSKGKLQKMLVLSNEERSVDWIRKKQCFEAFLRHIAGDFGLPHSYCGAALRLHVIADDYCWERINEKKD